MSSVPEFNAARSAPRLLNGRLQACDPCRRRKVACDHKVPVCSRCLRKDISQSCVYMVGQARPRRRNRLHATPAQHVRQDASLDFSPGLSSISALPENNSGYLGATNFSAVFRDSPDLSTQGSRTPWAPGFVYQSPVHGQLETAVTILGLIPDRDTCAFLLQSHLQCTDGWSRLAAQLLNESIWTTFGPVLEEGKRSSEGLKRIASAIFRNSSTTFREDHDDPTAWLRSFSGSNLRWETLGILFTYWALGSKSLINAPEQRETDFLRSHDRRALIIKFKSVARMCIDLCYQGSSTNTLLASLLHKYSIVESVVSGDTSPQLWRLLGEVAAMATFLGLHVTAPSMINDHSISSEMKRRLFSMIYKNDKVLATFTGRPSLISARHSTTPLPLDISDEELFYGGPTSLARHLRVDSDGWSTTGEVYPMTMLRAKVMIAFIREEIIDIALQAKPSNEDPQRLAKLKERHLNMFASLPVSLTYDQADIDDLRVSSATLVARLTTRISHLQNLFFIERLQNKGNALPSAEFLDISVELVSLPLMPWKHPERLATLRGDDCTWLVLNYAAPAVGILAMELLRGKAGGRVGVCRGQGRVTRSMIIQLLGILCGFLDTVGPTAPNTHCCYTVSKTIQSVLDRALNDEGPIPATGQTDWIDDWSMELSMDMTDLFNYDLPDTFDWMRAAAT